MFGLGLIHFLNSEHDFRTYFHFSEFWDITRKRIKLFRFRKRSLKDIWRYFDKSLTCFLPDSPLSLWYTLIFFTKKLRVFSPKYRRRNNVLFLCHLNSFENGVFRELAFLGFRREKVSTEKISAWFFSILVVFFPCRNFCSIIYDAHILKFTLINPHPKLW